MQLEWFIYFKMYVFTVLIYIIYLMKLSHLKCIVLIQHIVNIHFHPKKIIFIFFKDKNIEMGRLQIQ